MGRTNVQGLSPFVDSMSPIAALVSHSAIFPHDYTMTTQHLIAREVSNAPLAAGSPSAQVHGAITMAEDHGAGS